MLFKIKPFFSGIKKINLREPSLQARKTNDMTVHYNQPDNMVINLIAVLPASR